MSGDKDCKNVTKYSYVVIFSVLQLQQVIQDQARENEGLSDALKAERDIYTNLNGYVHFSVKYGLMPDIATIISYFVMIILLSFSFLKTCSQVSTKFVTLK